MSILGYLLTSWGQLRADDNEHTGELLGPQLRIYAGIAE